MKNKAIVLLSAGLDSTVNLYKAIKEYKVILALTFDYGQRAANSELTASARIASRLKIPHQVVYLGFMVDYKGSALIDRKKKVPVGPEIQIDSLKVSKTSASAVWVPNRNGIMLNIAAGYAEDLGADYIIPGFNSEEAKTFPDNSEKFMKALDQSFKFSTANKVQVKCFTSKMNKTQIVLLGKKLGVKWSDLWPCYFSGDRWCGECESCLRTLRALKNAGVSVT